ncbi:hypothetical protein GXM_06359 [Nostoc sphaeroides CCNUC1]|uniref:Uncharacterized protein n=1 Tax=Nostoc sphaeroides CCNUC1 TaxID=2653204 RepID=A0A5P8W7X5_9NOSO|nr:hypothetical protein GXM_06359 [Nostoc sphaeroides CCNUC1]
MSASRKEGVKNQEIIQMLLWIFVNCHPFSGFSKGISRLCQYHESKLLIN